MRYWPDDVPVPTRIVSFKTEDESGVPMRIHVRLSMQCFTCKHYIDRFTCEAFEVIPPAIREGRQSHSEPFPGDKGITYEPMPLYQEVVKGRLGV